MMHAFNIYRAPSVRERKLTNRVEHTETAANNVRKQKQRIVYKNEQKTHKSRHSLSDKVKEWISGRDENVKQSTKTRSRQARSDQSLWNQLKFFIKHCIKLCL